jgi:quinol monooxygenase YgiN
MEKKVKTIVSHKVSDYNAWRAVFDQLEPIRKAAGELEHEVATSIEDPNYVYVINEWANLDSAKAWFSKPELKAGMQKAGVIGAPNFTYLSDK